MKIVVISEFYKNHENDILVYDIVQELKASNHIVEVISLASMLPKSQFNKMQLVFGLDYKRLVLNKWFNYFYKIVLIFFKYSINKHLFVDNYKIVLDKFEKNSFKPNLILQFTGGVYEEYLFKLAKSLSTKYDVPRYIHSYDPIPGTIEWGEKSIIRDATLKVLKEYFKSADKVSAVSPMMANYLKEVYGLNEKNVSTFYMPINYSGGDYNNQDKISFLYLGSIYGKRNPDSLFNVLNKIMGQNQNIELVLSGSKLNKDILLKQYDNFKYGLRFIEWTDKPDDLINNSDILIDLNADIEGDVFISSKLMKYLGYNRPILVIGNKKSASFEFSTKFTSVFFASNSEPDIFLNILKIKQNTHKKFCRKHEVEAFSLKNSVLEFIKI